MAHDESVPVPPLPEPGFYYHYKHDSAGSANKYAYEVIGVACDTEDNEKLSVLYRPLYESRWLPPANYAARPLRMFMEDVTKDGVTKSRFERIADPEVLRELEVVRAVMYGL